MAVNGSATAPLGPVRRAHTPVVVRRLLPASSSWAAKSVRRLGRARCGCRTPASRTRVLACPRRVSARAGMGSHLHRPAVPGHHPPPGGVPGDRLRGQLPAPAAHVLRDIGVIDTRAPCSSRSRSKIRRADPLTARLSRRVADRLSPSAASEDASASGQHDVAKSAAVAIRFSCQRQVAPRRSPLDIRVWVGGAGHRVRTEVPLLARRPTIMAEGPRRESLSQHRSSTPKSCVSARSGSTGSRTPSR